MRGQSHDNGAGTRRAVALGSTKTLSIPTSPSPTVSFCSATLDFAVSIRTSRQLRDYTFWYMGEFTEANRKDPESDGPRRGRKFYLALACYAAISLLAAFTLDGKIRWVVWIFMGWLAFRTYLETLRRP